MTALPARVPQAGIAERIEQLIAQRGLQPGDRLPPERALAEELGVSRPSLREVIKTLEAVGRVRVRHGTGVWLQAADEMRRLQASRDVGLEELFAMREVLEVPAAGWAATARPPAGVERLALLMAEMETVGSIDDLRRHDIEFHLGIAEMAGNRFLLRTMGVLHAMLEQGMETTLKIPGRLERSRVEHRRLLAAIRGGDSGAAQRAMRTHIRGAQRAAATRLAGKRGSG